jgi:glycine cleavage system T protein (aminomethyltransferase)
MTLKRTPLYEEHQKLGAKMVEFGGWEMPIQYAGLMSEHLAVRQNVGMFDTGHMGVVKAVSSQLSVVSSEILMRSVDQIEQGQVRYNRLINGNGGVVDDLLVYKKGDDHLLVLNASNVEKDIEFLKNNGIETDVLDYHIIAVQGPKAEELLQKHTGLTLAEIKYYTFSEGKFDELDIIFSRTGYTGEKGFELFVKSLDCPVVWQSLLASGVTPCGLGARDTLRIEAGMPLYGHELKDEWTSKQSNSIFGIQITERGIPRQGYKVFDVDKNTEIGEITSGTFSPSLKKPIGLAMVGNKNIGDEIYVQVRQQFFKGTLVKPSFINNTK